MSRHNAEGSAERQERGQDPWDLTADLALGRRQPRQTAAPGQALADAAAARTATLAQLRQLAHDDRPGLPT